MINIEYGCLIAGMWYTSGRSTFVGSLSSLDAGYVLRIPIDPITAYNEGIISTNTLREAYAKSPALQSLFKIMEGC